MKNISNKKNIFKIALIALFTVLIGYVSLILFYKPYRNNACIMSFVWVVDSPGKPIPRLASTIICKQKTIFFPKQISVQKHTTYEGQLDIFSTSEQYLLNNSKVNVSVVIDDSNYIGKGNFVFAKSTSLNSPFDCPFKKIEGSDTIRAYLKRS